MGGEHQPEMIIDGPTTRNIQMNYPGIMKAIQMARVPQYAEGFYPPAPVSGATPGIDNIHFMNAVADFKNTVANLKQTGIRAYMVHYDFETFDNYVKKTRTLGKMFPTA